jgi:hypothetical protein
MVNRYEVTVTWSKKFFLLHSRMTINNDISKKTRRKDSECFHHKEMTNVYRDVFVYPDWSTIYNT